MKLDIIHIPTYNVKQLAIADASRYDTQPPVVGAPTIEITPPGFDKVVLAFTVQTTNVFNSVTLNITEEEQALPDGVYQIKYSVSPAAENFVEKSLMRVDKLQEKFDEAFMTLEVMECDGPIKTQAKEALMRIYFLIQASIAAANECALVESQKLYKKADSMIDSFLSNDCGCSGNSYILAFY